MQLLRKKLMNGYNVKLGQWDESHNWEILSQTYVTVGQSHCWTKSLLQSTALMNVANGNCERLLALIRVTANFERNDAGHET